MNYAENNLLRGESIIYRAQLHWAIFLAPIFWGLIFLIVFGIGASDNFYDEDIIYAIAIFGVIFLGSLLRAIVRKVSSEYTLTNKRLIMKHGIISRRTVELMLIKCEGISVDQGILGHEDRRPCRVPQPYQRPDRRHPLRHRQVGLFPNISP